MPLSFLHALRPEVYPKCSSDAHCPGASGLPFLFLHADIWKLTCAYQLGENFGSWQFRADRAALA
jgi:hypothetical protein